MRLHRFVLLTVLFVAIGHEPAVAQPMPSSPTIGGVAAFGSIRARAYSYDWFGDDPDGEYSYPGVLIRLGLAQTRRPLDWQVEFAIPILLNLPTEAVKPA